MKCPECGENLLEHLEEVLVVTIQRTSKILGIQYETEDGEVLFDYEGITTIEDDMDVDTPAYYQCGYCGYSLTKGTVVELLKTEPTEDYVERTRLHI